MKVKPIFSISLLIAAVILHTSFASTNHFDLKSCRSQMAPDSSLDLKTLIPSGYRLRRSFWYDLDADTQVELLLYCTSNKKVECVLVEDQNCYLDELLVFESEKGWKLHHTFPIYQPLTTDSESVELNLDSVGVLTLENSFMPTCCSSVWEKQYFSYHIGEFVLDSFYHRVTTKAGAELYGWEYNVDLGENRLEFYSSYWDMRYEGSEIESDTIINLSIKRPYTVFNKIELEDFLPSNVETPWY